MQSHASGWDGVYGRDVPGWELRPHSIRFHRKHYRVTATTATASTASTANLCGGNRRLWPKYLAVLPWTDVLRRHLQGSRRRPLLIGIIRWRVLLRELWMHHQWRANQVHLPEAVPKL